MEAHALLCVENLKNMSWYNPARIDSTSSFLACFRAARVPLINHDSLIFRKVEKIFRFSALFGSLCFPPAQHNYFTSRKRTFIHDVSCDSYVIRANYVWTGLKFNLKSFPQIKDFRSSSLSKNGTRVHLKFRPWTAAIDSHRFHNYFIDKWTSANYQRIAFLVLFPKSTWKSMVNFHTLMDLVTYLGVVTWLEKGSSLAS